ncbi:hypothetical protein ACO0K7_15740 [Undibacterium sp. Ji67W]|uniref:hypothetical protein n=1 Tax=Undibacterium sp. Ji67W TaxID=3413042 RepID=UPI003BF27C1D
MKQQNQLMQINAVPIDTELPIDKLFFSENARTVGKTLVASLSKKIGKVVITMYKFGRF